MAYMYAQKMTYCECMMPHQIAWEAMNRLGNMQLIHFENKIINYENPFIKNFKRCDEVVSKVNEIKKFIKLIKNDFALIEPQSYKDSLKQFQAEIKLKSVLGHLYINQIEQQISQIHGYLQRQMKEVEYQQKKLHELILNAALLLTVCKSPQVNQIYQEGAMDEEGNQKTNIFDYKCVIINRTDQMQVKRGLFRISRGNAWIEMLEIVVHQIKEMFGKQYDFLNTKLVCVVIFQKGEANMLGAKINKFLNCIETTSLHSPPNRWKSELQSIHNTAKEVSNLLDMTNDANERYLHKLHEPRNHSTMSNLAYLELYAKKEREIYKSLSYTTVSNNFLHFNIYIPSKELPLHIQPNEHLPPLMINPKHSDNFPPSKFDSPPILQIPQIILNTYGVPSYDEFNPAILYIVTFGFFIGVMFGDVGHMLLAIPLLIVFKANIWAWTIIFWMGYCGFIYNQFFGLNLGIFSSCYPVNYQTGKYIHTDDCVYAFGVDSIWKTSSNQMQYINSLKMKLSVIIGIVHMLLGLGIRFINCFKRKDYVDLITLTIPQTIFMMSTFVYMDCLIVKKWLTQYEDSKQAPSIIATMISAFAGFGSSGDLLFWESQKKLQKFLLTMAISMIPIMLLGKPLVIRYQQNSIVLNHDPENNDFVDQEKISDNQLSDDNKNSLSIHHFKGNKSHHDLKQIFVHQFIQTIEYVLGSVSNTASYLRLWALSLAHGQLAEVIFDLTMKKFIVGGYSSILGLLIGFPFFLAVTFGVLICMDTMECFLHSLRLHWVQFQNKFYAGKGYEFQPFTFKDIKDIKEVS